MTSRETLITKLNNNGYKYRVTELKGLEMLDKASDPIGTFVINDNYTIIEYWSIPDLCQFIQEDIERAKEVGKRHVYC